uniref:Uncharacterized protein n=1 Tax=Falco tinnunculus TaxID=100819 RepID=A0A8C4UVC6_FALTI
MRESFASSYCWAVAMQPGVMLRGPGSREDAVEGIKSIALAADVSKPEDVQKVVDTIVARWGTVHIACNNAGINMNSASEDTSLEEWDKTFNVNLRGLFLCCQVSVKCCAGLFHKWIIIFKSRSDLFIFLVLFPSFPSELTSQTPISIAFPSGENPVLNSWWCAHCRGIVDTPLIHSKDLQPLVQRWLADIPAGRLAQATDLQAAVVYLASEASDYMTGHNLVIEGGQSLW